MWTLKLRSLSKKFAWLLIILTGLNSLLKVASKVSDIDFVIEARGNRRLVAVWNYLTTPAGNLIVLACGLLYLFYLAKHPPTVPKEDGEQVFETATKDDKQDTVASAEKSPESTPEAKPNLVLIRTRLAHTDTHYNGVASIKFERSNMDELNTAVVEFGNEIGVDGASARITDLQARITFYDQAGNFYHRVNKGQWVDERFPFINLDVGQTARLILLHRTPGNFGKYNDKVKRYHISDNPNEEQGVSDHHAHKVIDGQKFRAQVILLCGSQREVIGTYDFDLTLEPLFEVKAATPEPPPLS